MEKTDFSVPFHSSSELLPGQEISVNDLDFYALLRRQSSNGSLYFNQRRAVIFDTEALGTLRQQLIDTLGKELAMGVLTRFGYTHGYNDAKTLGENFNWETETDWLAAGPSIHTLEGIVHVTPEKIEFDRETGDFQMQGIWLNSYEAEEHLKRYGPGDHPVCWTLTGYASGYTSGFFGQELLAIETECVGKGDERCYWEIRPVEEWGPEAEPYLKAMEQVDLSGELFKVNQQLQTQTQQLTLLNQMSTELNQAASVEEIFKITAAKANSIVQGSRTSVALLNEEGNQFEIFALDGVKGAIPVGAKLPFEGTAIGESVKTNQLINTPDIANSKFLEHKQLAKQGLQSTMTVPLVAGAHPIGTLNVGSKELNAFGPHDETIMLQMASLLASAVENRRLIEQAQQRAEELEETTTFLDSILDNIPAMVFVKEAEELRFVRWNKAGEELVGFKNEDMINKNDYDFFPKKEADFFVAKDRQVLKDGKLVEISEEPIQTASGDIRLLHTRKVPVMGPDGKYKYLLGISEDITERKQRESELRKLSQAVEQSSSTVVITNLDGYIEYANPRFAETTGYTLEEAIGQHTRILKSGETSTEEYKQMWETIAAGGEWHGEFHNKRKNGELYWEFASISPIRNEAGDITHFLAVKEDITERKEQQEAAARNEAVLRSVIDAIPDWIFITDSNHRYQLANQGYAATFGLTPDQVVGRTAIELGLPEDIVKGNPQKDIKGFWPDDEEILASGKMKEIEIEPTVIDGEQRYINSIKIPLANSEGEYNALLCYVRDVTRRKETEEAIKESQNLYQSSIDGLPQNVYRIDKEGRIVFGNKVYQETLGMSREEFLGKTAYDFFPKELADKYTADDQTVMESEKILDVVEAHAVPATGEMNYVQTVKTPVKDSEGNVIGLQGVFWDVTEQKQAELALTKRAAELQTASEVSIAISTLLDVDELLQNVVDLTKARFNLYHAHIYLLDKNGQLLNLAAGAGDVGRKMVKQGWSIALNKQDSLVARAARSRQGVIVNNVREASDWLPNPLLPDTFAELAVPMIVGDKVLGVFDVQSDTVGYFTEEDINIQTTVATQVAVALQNASLFEQAQNSAQRLSTLNDMTTVLSQTATVDEALQVAAIKLGDVIQSDRTSLTMLTPEGDKLELFALKGVEGAIPVGKQLPVNGTALGWAATTRKIFVANDTQGSDFLDVQELANQGIRCVVAVPMIVGGKTFGTLNVASMQSAAFNNDDQAILTQVASTLASIIENRRFLEQAQTRARREQLLREVTSRIRGSVDVDTVMRTAVQEVGRALGRQAFVYLGNEENGKDIQPSTTEKEAQND